MKDVVPAPAGKVRSAKGDRTKQSIEDAARIVFDKAGYLNARVQDIAAEAGLSNGAFYRYFTDKRSVMLSIVSKMLDTAFGLARSPWSASDPIDSVYQTTERYLTFYAQNADLFRVLNEVSQTDAEVEQLWSDFRVATMHRIERMLERAQGQGLIREGLDFPVVAALLTAMTDHYAYLWLVVKRVPDREIPIVSRQIADLWSQGVFSKLPT